MGGVTLGALAGIGFGLFQAVNRRVNAAMDVYRATFALLLVGSVLLGALSIATQDISQVWQAPARSLAAFAAGGFVHFFGGWTFLGLSQQRIGAAKTGALLGTIPLLGALAAALVLREMLTGTALAALVIVVIGVGAVTLGRPRGEHPPEPLSVSGVAFALAAATCWAVSPLLIRVGLDGLSSPLLGVTVGMWFTALACGAGVAIMPSRSEDTPVRTVLGPVVVAGTLVGLSIWLYWTALAMEKVGVVLAVLQLSSPTVALVAPLVSGDPIERGGGWFWVGLGLIFAGSVTLLLRQA